MCVAACSLHRWIPAPWEGVKVNEGVHRAGASLIRGRPLHSAVIAVVGVAAAAIPGSHTISWCATPYPGVPPSLSVCLTAGQGHTRDMWEVNQRVEGSLRVGTSAPDRGLTRGQLFSFIHPNPPSPAPPVPRVLDSNIIGVDRAQRRAPLLLIQNSYH